MIDCPISGCPKVSEGENGICNHMMNKQDSAHAEFETYSDALAHLQESNQSEQSPDAGGSSGGGDDPSMDPVDPPLPDSGSNGGTADEPECPECGSGRYFDASGHTEYPYGCANCSDEETWVVYE